MFFRYCRYCNTAFFYKLIKPVADYSAFHFVIVHFLLLFLRIYYKNHSLTAITAIISIWVIYNPFSTSRAGVAGVGLHPVYAVKGFHLNIVVGVYLRRCIISYSALFHIGNKCFKVLTLFIGYFLFFNNTVQKKDCFFSIIYSASLSLSSALS